ncbi:MAG: hypothetical protein D6769_00425 [Methanobacteriota archaeon]|nr:MAG: hypothetical protein D6769_00425 [Euryarchaeota archaeon]
MVELLRQVTHVFLGIAILAFSVSFGLEATAYALFALTIAYSLLLYASTMGWVKLLYIFIRKNELFPGSGALYYVASLLFIASYPHTTLPVFAAALLALAMGDGFSTLCGNLPIEKHKLFNGKSLEGSFGGLVVLFLAYAVAGYPLIVSVALSLAYALVELLSPIDDNITVPLTIAILAFYII